MLFCNIITLYCVGLLFLSLRGTPIDDNGFVNVHHIGNSNPDDRLLCLTNDTNCCSSTQTGGAALGGWNFPNGTAVGGRPGNDIVINNGNFFSRDRGQNVVRLLRHKNPSERGHFSCVLLGDTIYVNICE